VIFAFSKSECACAMAESGITVKIAGCIALRASRHQSALPLASRSR
jgi:hypothetical protein